MQYLLKILIFSVLIFNIILPTYQQIDSALDEADTMDDNDDDDDCAFISGQRCDQNGICKYCAMCIESSCILSKTVNSNSINCNATQFGINNLYNWYDYCLSSENDEDGSYCATSTECYQYRKNSNPSVMYAWHNLTCNPSTCMLIASDGAPPPISEPLPPPPPQQQQQQQQQQQPSNNNNLQSNNSNSHSENNRSGIEHNNSQSYYSDKSSFHNPAVIALTAACCLVLSIALLWTLRICIKNRWWPFTKQQNIRIAKGRLWRKKGLSEMESIDHASLSSIPNSAPPSFSSISPDLSTLRQPHQAYLYTGQPSFSSNISSDTSSIHNNREPLPAYLSLYASPPKYEQAIVTQIRDLREESDSSSVNDLYHQDAAPIPSMWVPVYFAHTSNFGRRINNPNLLNFAPNHTMPSYWIQSVTQPLNHQTSLGDVSNPFDDNYQSIEHQQESES